MYFCFDTETTGLPIYNNRKGYHDPRNYENYNTSRIVSISWIILDSTLDIIDKQTHLIKPDGFIIPEQSIKIHGITNERANQDGCNMKTVLDIIVSKLHLINVLVAHNVYFDVNILRAECFRYDYGDIAEIVRKGKKYCTMERGKALLALSKNPKLSELYKVLYDEEMQNAHDAEYDTYYCCQCFVMLKNMPDRDPEEIINKKRQSRQKRRMEHNYSVDKKPVFLLGDSSIKLNEEQCDIVFAPTNSSNATLILAVAGSGKTTTLVCRLKHLVDMGTPEHSIILTTFTRDAANDMERKIELAFGYKPEIAIGTIDSLALKYVKKYKPELLNDFTNNVGEYAVRFLEMLKCEDGKLLLGDIQHLFIDEFQDINNIQYKIIKEFYKHGTTITAVGDDAQNIYTFRGSDIKYILNFQNYFPNGNILRLSINYRSTRQIVAFANATIEKNDFQIPKSMVSFSNEDYVKPKICFFDKSAQQYNYIKDKILEYKANGFQLSQIAVLCPQNSFLYQLEEVLTKHEICNTLLDGKSDIRTCVKDDHVCLSTIHKSKGLEWDIVFLLMMNDEIFPSKKHYTDICESRRLFYVGVTRPRKLLFITYAPIFDCKYVCRFVSEVDSELCSFYNFGHHCIGLSLNSYTLPNMTITKMIEKLDGNDYVHLKQMGILYDISQSVEIFYDGDTYKEFIVKNDIYSDFGNFLDVLLTRMIGEHDDEYATLALACVKMDFTENMVYQKYKLNFQSNLPFVAPLAFDVFDNMSKIIKQLVRKDINPQTCAIESDDISCILGLINKMYANATKYKVPLEKVPLFTEKFLPVDFEKQMSIALDEYVDKTKHWGDILQAIWEVSKCRSIVGERRRRLLYKNIAFADIMSYQTLFENIQDYVVPYILNKGQPICHESYKDTNGVVGIVDIRVCDTMFEMKCSNDENIKAEHILKLLCNKHLYEKHTGGSIKTIGVINVLKGKITNLDVKDFNKGGELLDYLVNKTKQ